MQYLFLNVVKADENGKNLGSLHDVNCKLIVSRIPKVIKMVSQITKYHPIYVNTFHCYAPAHKGAVHGTAFLCWNLGRNASLHALCHPHSFQLAMLGGDTLVHQLVIVLLTSLYTSIKLICIPSLPIPEQIISLVPSSFILQRNICYLLSLHKCNDPIYQNQ